MQRYRQRVQNHQVYLHVMPSAVLSYAKISPTNAESSSLLECYAECSFILCKGTLLYFNVKINANIICCESQWDIRVIMNKLLLITKGVT